MSSVDVVIPCYRYGHYLRQCVESVLSQADVALRVLIIDDCSPDDTRQVGTTLSREDPRVTFRRHEKNQGHIATYNEGIEWTAAKYYLLLSADDYLLPGALGRTARLMDANPAVGLAYGQAPALQTGEMPVLNAQSVGDDWQVHTGEEFIAMSGARNQVPTPAALVRTEIQKRIGGYRPELPHTGDLEMWLRLAAHAHVGISQANHAVYRRHAANMSLLYTAKSSLPDIGQRREAFDTFRQSCGHALPGIDTIHCRCLRLLAGEAMEFAHSAFNHGDFETSVKLADLALELSPEIRNSLQWTKLYCKRRMGLNTWQMLRAPLVKMRQRAAQS